MTDFFISYNHADATWAEWIAWQLEQAGYTTILQAWDFRPSQNFVLKMNEAIRASERMVAVLSPDYMTASFSSPEWAAAFARDPKGDKGILLPVRVRECDLQGLFDQIIHIDLVGKDEEEARQALLAGIQTERAKPLSKPKFPRTTERLITEHPSFPGPRTKKRSSKYVKALVIFFTVLIVVLAAFWPSFKRWQEPVIYCPKSASGEVRYYEAEEAELWGSASKDSEHLGFSGEGYVSGYGAETEAFTTFSIDVPSDGQYQLDLCYANATKSAKVLSIYVNEVRVKQTRLSNAPRWNMWLMQSETLPLKAGYNKISYRKTTGDSGQVNLDFIGILQKSISTPTPLPTATVPKPKPSVGVSPSPSPGVTPKVIPQEPTQGEMKEALLLEMENRGAKRNDANSVSINNPIAGMVIRIEAFAKLGCKPAGYGVGYECTYTIKLSNSFHSNDGTQRGEEQLGVWNKYLGGPLGESTATKKFVKGTDCWIIVQD